MKEAVKTRWVEALLVAVCAAVCAVQLLLPGYIGLANNGDFGKVFARFACSPPDGGARNFIYFVADYEYAARYYWKSSFVSDEIVLAGVPILAVRTAGAAAFNIRWLGALHALLFVAAYYVMLVYLRRWGWAVQVVLGLAAVWIFADVAYLAYFNSFFSDAAGIVGLLAMVVAGLHLTAQSPPRRVTLCWFAAAAALFICSKTQHGFWGFLPAMFAVGVTWRHRAVRAWGGAVCAVLLACEIGIFWATPLGYGNEALFNLIFFKLAPRAAAPEAVVREFGLDERDFRWIGTNAFMEGSPTADPAWLADFGRRTSYGTALRFYARHPGEALRVLAGDLREQAPMMRPPNLSNFRQEQGRPAGALTNRFASWSNLRRWLFFRRPSHIAVWYAAFVGAALALLARGAWRSWSVVLALGVAAMGIGEFGFASLADACETYRHLLLFHLLTDVTVCLAAGWGLTRLTRARRVA